MKVYVDDNVNLMLNMFLHSPFGKPGSNEISRICRIVLIAIKIPDAYPRFQILEYVLDEGSVFPARITYTCKK